MALIAGQSRGRRPDVGTGSAGVIDDVGVLLLVGVTDDVGVLLLVGVTDDVGVLLLVGVAEGVEEGLRVKVSSC